MITSPGATYLSQQQTKNNGLSSRGFGS